MATPATPQKRLMAYGAKKGAVWGTEVALGATFGLLTTGIGSPAPNRPYIPIKEADTPFVLTGLLGQEAPVPLAVATNLRYEPTAWGTLAALFFGTAGAPVQQAATIAYLHTLAWLDSISGKFATIACERPSKIFSIPSAKPHTLTMSWADGLFKAVMMLTGNKVIDSSAVNTFTQMDAITYNDRFNLISTEQSTIKMNATGGADVAGETALVAKSVEVSYQRPMDTEHVGGELTQIEPLQNDYPIVTVKIGFPRMSAINNLYMADFIAGTMKKVLISSTGVIIVGAYNYYQKLFFPNMRITKVEYQDDAEIIPASVELIAEDIAAAPTGMTLTKPYITLMNKKTTDYLA